MLQRMCAAENLSEASASNGSLELVFYCQGMFHGVRESEVSAAGPAGCSHKWNRAWPQQPGAHPSGAGAGGRRDCRARSAGWSRGSAAWHCKRGAAWQCTRGTADGWGPGWRAPSGGSRQCHAGWAGHGGPAPGAIEKPDCPEWNTGEPCRHPISTFHEYKCPAYSERFWSIRFPCSSSGGLLLEIFVDLFTPGSSHFHQLLVQRGPRQDSLLQRQSCMFTRNRWFLGKPCLVHITQKK